MLKHYDEFKSVLASYQISADAKETLKDLKLVLLMAPTSTGRSVIVKHLVQSGQYHYIVSDTTRAPQVRDGQLEQNGVQYFFRTEEELLADLKAGNFLEAELIHEQQVSGISIRELKKAQQSGKIAFTETDIAGVANIKQVKSDTVAIFLLPPSFAEWRRRMEGRGGVEPQELNRRLKTAARFLQEAPTQEYFQLVIADDASKAVSIINDLVAGKPNPEQDQGRKLAQELFADLQKVIH